MRRLPESSDLGRGGGVRNCFGGRLDALTWNGGERSQRGARPLASAAHRPHPQDRGQAFGGSPFGDRHCCARRRGDLWPAGAKERLGRLSLLRAFPGTGPAPPAFQGESRLKT